jgi:hypothetical protein
VHGIEVPKMLPTLLVADVPPQRLDCGKPFASNPLAG